MMRIFEKSLIYKKNQFIDLPFNHDEGFYSLEEKGNLYALVNYQYFPIIWTLKDKSFLCWQQRDGEPWNNESMVLCYDHNTKKISNSFDWGEITPPDSDVHLMPTVIGTKDERILMLEENPHAGPMHIKRSSKNYDISSYQYLGSFGNDLSYPHITKFSDGTLYSVFRGSGPVYSHDRNYTRLVTYKSNNNGKSWEDLGTITYQEGTGSTSELWYQHTPYSSDDKLRVFINRRISSGGVIAFPYLYYLESIDGVVWYSVDRKYRWDVRNGPAPLGLLDDHFLVLKYANGLPVSGKSIKAIGGCVNNLGNPMTLVKNENDNGIKLLYWDGSLWIEKPVSVSGRNLVHADSAPLICTKTNKLRAFITEIISGWSHISEFESNDFGDTWSFKRKITEGDINFVNPHLSGNFQDLGYGIFGCVAKVDENYSDLFIKEIM